MSESDPRVSKRIAQPTHYISQPADSTVLPGTSERYAVVVRRERPSIKAEKRRESTLVGRDKVIFGPFSGSEPRLHSSILELDLQE
jgi:hypothetical protein